MLAPTELQHDGDILRIQISLRHAFGRVPADHILVDEHSLRASEAKLVVLVTTARIMNDKERRMTNRKLANKFVQIKKAARD
jgi:hypothetical protein